MYQPQWMQSAQQQIPLAQQQQQQQGNLQNRIGGLEEQYKSAGSDQQQGLRDRITGLQGRFDKQQGTATGANRENFGWRQERRQANNAMAGGRQPQMAGSPQRGGANMPGYRNPQQQRGQPQDPNLPGYLDLPGYLNTQQQRQVPQDANRPDQGWQNMRYDEYRQNPQQYQQQAPQRWGPDGGFPRGGMGTGGGETRTRYDSPTNAQGDFYVYPTSAQGGRTPPWEQASQQQQQAPQGANRPGMEFRQERRQENRQAQQQAPQQQQQQAPQQQQGAGIPGYDGWYSGQAPQHQQGQAPSAYKGGFYNTPFGMLTTASVGDGRIFQQNGGGDLLYNYNPDQGWKSMTQDEYRGYGDGANQGQGYYDPEQYRGNANVGNVYEQFQRVRR